MVFLKYKEKIEEIVRVLVEREEYVGVGVGVGWLERMGVGVGVGVGGWLEIERVYEYYKYGREKGLGVKGKNSIRSMRESLSKYRLKEHSSDPSKEVSSDPLKEHSSEHSSDPSKEVSSDPLKEHSSEHSSDPSKEVSSKDFTEEDQLKYIMPIEILKEMGIEKDWDEEVSYEWAYCDYFWEADVIVTRIPLNKK